MKLYFKSYIKIILLIFMAFFLYYIFKNFPQNKEKNINNILDFYTIKPIKESYAGFVVSQYSIDLSFKTEGEIVFCPYTEGDFIKKGALLAQNDGVDYNLILKEEINKLQELKIKSARADKYYSRMNILHSAGAISDNDWEEAYYSAKSAKQEIEIQNEVVNRIKEKINNTKIFAPDDGFVLKKYLDKGEYAKIGETVLVINYSKNTQIETMVNFLTRQKIKLNDKVKISKDDKTYIGLIKHISSSSLDKGGYLTKIYLDKQYLDLKEGESVKVDFLTLKNGVFIPPKFIFENDEGYFVYKLNNNKIEKIKITTGQKQKIDKTLLIEVLEGLKINDEVVEIKKQ